MNISKTGVFQRYIAADRFDDSGAVLGETDKHAWPPSANALASRSFDLCLRYIGKQRANPDQRSDSRPLHVSIKHPLHKDIAPYSYLSCHLSRFGRYGEILILLPFGPSLSSTLLSKASLLGKLLMNLQVVYRHWGYVKPPVLQLKTAPPIHCRVGTTRWSIRAYVKLQFCPHGLYIAFGHQARLWIPHIMHHTCTSFNTHSYENPIKIGIFVRLLLGSRTITST